MLMLMLLPLSMLVSMSMPMRVSRGLSMIFLNHLSIIPYELLLDIFIFIFFSFVLCLVDLFDHVDDERLELRGEVVESGSGAGGGAFCCGGRHVRASLGVWASVTGEQEGRGEENSLRCG